MSPAATTETQTDQTPKSGPTGPRTEEGKQRSAMNALRHGLTGRTVVMPYEDMNAYRAFCDELFTDLAPESPIERQFAQTFCDTQWRLNRIRSVEDSMFALGHFEPAGNIDTDHPQVHAALTAACVFRDDSKSFVNLSLYEQRLQRTLEKSLKQLKELQTERRARLASESKVERATEREADRQHAPAARNALKTQEQPRPIAIPAIPRQFVFSNPVAAAPTTPQTTQTTTPQGPIRPPFGPRLAA